MTKGIKRNLVIIIILAFVVGGYASFFLSPRIFREGKENLLYTEPGQDVKAGSGFSVAVEDWQYCKQEQSMAVIFSFKNTNSDYYTVKGAKKGVTNIVATLSNGQCCKVKITVES